ncbi:Lsr2 dimerization domain-containing protein [Catenuloplanes indicus]|uniref:Lsr2 dimerization domain-containing protein n=1 Tax=Catenuloplanes indicus TaxID=137267 RepID=A0AAE4AXU1_9ACTN|nr:histone-like nucleoid-structuring protein Lsr2 [Catenuloplanes indicus]MDQ0364368.1 hypothetical protein [Catenuloplanes indicus]
MATRIVAPLAGDLDGGAADRTVTSGLDGVFCDIGLSERNAERLRAAPEPFIARAPASTGSGRRECVAT